MNEKELPRFNALIRSEYSRGYEPILTLGGARVHSCYSLSTGDIDIREVTSVLTGDVEYEIRCCRLMWRHILDNGISNKLSKRMLDALKEHKDKAERAKHMRKAPTGRRRVKLGGS